jgi:hypothetical protein
MNNFLDHVDHVKINNNNNNINYNFALPITNKFFIRSDFNSYIWWSSDEPHNWIINNNEDQTIWLTDNQVCKMFNTIYHGSINYGKNNNFLFVCNYDISKIIVTTNKDFCDVQYIDKYYTYMIYDKNIS